MNCNDLLMVEFAKQIDHLIAEPFVTTIKSRKGVKVITIQTKQADQNKLTVYRIAMQNWRFRLIHTSEEAESWSALTPWKNPCREREKRDG